MTAAPLIVSAVAVVRDRTVLMVTARSRDVYYLPGGKGETAEEAASREAFEEVSLQLEPADLEELFEVRTQAHGEPDGRQVHMRVFRAWTKDLPVPSSEVGAVHWTTSADAGRCPPAGVEVLRRLVQLDLID